jgi:N-carbamoylputrescine amidase
MPRTNLEFEIISSLDKVFDSPARKKKPIKEPFRLSIIQDMWHGSIEIQKEKLYECTNILSPLKPNLVVFQELTLNPYACTVVRSDDSTWLPEDLMTGATFNFAVEIAKNLKTHVVVSLYESPGEEDQTDAIGFNTAITVSPTGDLLMRTRKTHLPVTAGYFENTYFSNGEDGTPNVKINDVILGTPTCWDQWFPELARAYALTGADLLTYPTAIGSEPDHPDFDTSEIWRNVMVSHGIANGLFIAAPNRVGVENGIKFYGNSFISDPYGRVLVQADSETRSILISDLDLDQRRDWLELFPFFETRRPDTYSVLTNKLRDI